MDRKLADSLCGMEPPVQALMKLCCGDRPTQAQIAQWFSSVEFDALSSEAAYWAAMAGSTHDFAGVPDALIPRLKGIVKYVHTLNSSSLSALFYLTHVLCAGDIPVAALNETAACIAYPQLPVCHLWKAEAAVPVERYPQALKIAAEGGFSVTPSAGCAVLRRGNAQHLILYPYDHRGERDWSLHPVSVQGATVLIPDREQIVLSVADRFVETLKKPDAFGKRLSLLMRMRYLNQNIADPKSLAAAAEKSGQKTQVGLVLACMDFLGAGIAPETAALFGTREQTDQLARLLLRWRSVSQKGNRWSRLWLRVRIRTADAPETFLPGLFSALGRAAAGRLSSPDR